MIRGRFEYIVGGAPRWLEPPTFAVTGLERCAYDLPELDFDERCSRCHVVAITLLRSIPGRAEYKGHLPNALWFHGTGDLPDLYESWNRVYAAQLGLVENGLLKALWGVAST